MCDKKGVRHSTTFGEQECSCVRDFFEREWLSERGLTVRLRWEGLRLTASNQAGQCTVVDSIESGQGVHTSARSAEAAADHTQPCSIPAEHPAVPVAAAVVAVVPVAVGRVEPVVHHE